MQRYQFANQQLLDWSRRVKLSSSSRILDSNWIELISKIEIDNSNRIVNLKSKIDSKNRFESSRLSISIKKILK